MNRLRSCISFNSLALRRNRRGQIATFLLLGVVAVLIFALMTANLGQVALTSTRTANAADAAVLLLASQLATKARVLWETNDQKIEKCKKSGFLAQLIAIVAAVVLIVVTWGAAAPLAAMLPALVSSAMFVGVGTATTLTMTGAMIVGAIGGAVGGAIGGAIDGQGALFGALQGAVIGAAIGGAMSGTVLGGGQVVAGAPAASAGGMAPETTLMLAGDMGAPAATMGADGLVTVGASAGEFSVTGATVLDTASVGGTQSIGGVAMDLAPGTAVPSGSTVVSGSTVTALTSPAGAALGGSISASSSLYTAVAQDQMRGDAFAAAAKALSGLPDNERFRENTFFQALLQTVDDPNQVPDAPDTDQDGDTSEQVPAFQVWWSTRLKDIAGSVPMITKLTEQFLGQLKGFDAKAKATFTSSQACDQEGVCKTVGGSLSRQEVEGGDGIIVLLARTLELSGREVPFWKPGPGGEQINAWQQSECSTCSAPAGFDELDFINATLREISEVASGEPDDPDDGLTEMPVSLVSTTWQNWMKLFFDPEDDGKGDFHDMVSTALAGGTDGIAGISAWGGQFESIRAGLPVCQPLEVCDENGTCTITGIANPPCRGGGLQPGMSGSLAQNFGTIDQDLEDEFALVKQAIAELQSDLEGFRGQVKSFYDAMLAQSQLPEQSGGVNPVQYAWTDSRGAHKVLVEVGPFRIAFIKAKSKGSFLSKKNCLQLRDYTDDGTNTWVKIVRQDPVREAGFWKWNAHGGATSKMARAAYSFDFVKMAGTK